LLHPEGPARIVFVAGISFSGSTLMGLMPGSRPGIVFGGELKDYKRLKLLLGIGLKRQETTAHGPLRAER
jgi:hypothetical protein